MLVETVLSMLTLVCHLKKVMHRGWAYFQARLAFTMAAFNVVAYPRVADNISGPLLYRLCRLTQSVMSPPNRFSTPLSPLLACI